MEKDGRTARPRAFSSPEAYWVSRRAFKKLIYTPALTKMTVLLAKNKEMKIHTAALIAARYTTGACANSIARRLVIHFPERVSEIMNVGNVRRHFVGDDIVLSDKGNIIMIKILNLIEDHIEENFFPFLALDRVTFEIFFNNSERLSSEISWFFRALGILRLMWPEFLSKLIFDLP